MKKTITAFVYGFAFAMVVVAPVILYSRTRGRLIDAWQEVDLGMRIDDVNQRLGEAAYDFKVGQSWPAWAPKSIPEVLRQEHGLRVFYIGGFGPQLLMVLYDESGRIAFVTSTST